jgi:hypothetical protein
MAARPDECRDDAIMVPPAARHAIEATFAGSSRL